MTDIKGSSDQKHIYMFRRDDDRFKRIQRRLEGEYNRRFIQPEVVDVLLNHFESTYQPKGKSRKSSSST